MESTPTFFSNNCIPNSILSCGSLIHCSILNSATLSLLSCCLFTPHQMNKKPTPVSSVWTISYQNVKNHLKSLTLLNVSLAYLTKALEGFSLGGAQTRVDLSGNFLVVLQVGLGSHLGCSTHTVHLHFITHFEMMGPKPRSQWAIESGGLTSVTLGLRLT